MCAGCSFDNDVHGNELRKPQYARNSENSKNGLEGAVFYNPRSYRDNSY
jgi:hypothetical protein